MTNYHCYCHLNYSLITNYHIRYCLTSLDDDFLLRHYDSGDCHGKLGHSRASVIWHRAQVTQSIPLVVFIDKSDIWQLP